MSILAASPTQSVWMPPALIEDPEAAAVEEGEGFTIEGILWGLIPGSSLVDGYQAYQKGNYVSAAFNGAMGLFDLATMGAVSKAKAIVKSGGRAIYGVVTQTARNARSLMDDCVRVVRGNLDNAGKGLMDDTATGGATICRFDVEANQFVGCFAAGTPILTPFGSKPIEEIGPGDWVLAQDESDPEAVPQPRVVEEVFRNLAQMMTLRVGGHTIETTPEHPFWVRGRGWTPAEAIEPGDELRSHDGQWIPLEAKEFSEALIPVFNMRVAEDHTYFVGSPLWGFSVWAHNSYDREYEEYIQRNRGGSGEFKLKTNGRTFDGELPDGTWYEAKGGFGNLFEKDGSINLHKWSMFTTQITSQMKEARRAGKRYLLIVRVEPPPRVLRWINRNNVPYEVYP